MKKVVLGLFVAAVVLMGAASAQAQVIKLSLWDDICIPNEDYTGGLELAIGTQTREVEGVQLALIYAQADKFTGVQWGLVNNTNDGLGVQWGFVNLAQDMKGVQLSAVNWTKGNLMGVQWGWVNYADNVTGVQFGLVNWANTMKGVQLGLVNVIKNNTMFLPVFVFFNFCF